MARRKPCSCGRRTRYMATGALCFACAAQAGPAPEPRLLPGRLLLLQADLRTVLETETNAGYDRTRVATMARDYRTLLREWWRAPVGLPDYWFTMTGAHKAAPADPAQCTLL